MELNCLYTDFVAKDDWQYYATKTFRETKERDRVSIGGPRPNQSGEGLLGGEGDDDEGGVGDVSTDQVNAQC